MSLKIIKNKISKNEIKRLSEVAGVLRIDVHVYQLVKDIIMMLVRDITTRTKIIADYKERKTLKRDDVMSAFQTKGISISAPFIFESMKGKSQRKKKKKDSTTVHRFRPGVKTRMNIPRLQKSSNKFLIRPKPFRDLVREVIGDVRISKNTFYLLQFYIESTIIKLFRQAYLIPLNERTNRKKPRVSLFPKDISLAAELTGLGYFY